MLGFGYILRLYLAAAGAYFVVKGLVALYG